MLTVESAGDGPAAMRTRSTIVESTRDHQAPPNLRTRLLGVETNVDHNFPPNLRTRGIVVEALMEVLEAVMATEVFPGTDPLTGDPIVLKGLAFDVQKRPMFSNKIVQHTSGEETATSYWENPRWEYTMTYDYLPDRPVSVGETDLHTLMGFFLSRRGSFEAWLFRDPDDYTVTAGFQKIFDGVTVDFNLVRGMGGFYEPVGQLNTDETLDVWLETDETRVIPVTPGPYVVTTNHTPTVLPVVTIGATTLTEVVSAPTANQYTRSGHTYTFNSARQGQTVVFHYQYLVDPADYTITMPNVIAFDTAPPVNSIATASFQYYFVCRFKDDEIEFNKFMNQLWELQEVNFRSLIQ
jgi:hypothetical protein